MERRFRRNYVCFPVDLVFGEELKKVQAPPSVIDISGGGLRVHTGPRLIPGGLVEVFVEGRRKPFAYCRVVWSATHRSARPSEVVIEIVGRPAGDSNHTPKGVSALGREGGIS